jgi:[protein-PII] uridylyltransferase
MGDFLQINSQTHILTIIMTMRSPADELKESKTRLVAQLSNGGRVSNFHEQYTELMDHYFRRCLQESKVGPALFKKGNPFAFVSVGGYGRMELCLHSDIDIMILFHSRIPPRAKELAEEVLYPLWDLGLDLGYGIRSLKDCVSLSKKDFEVLTSLLDARFLCGDSPLYLSLMERIQKKVVSKSTIPVSRWLEDQDKVRMAMFGDASHLLEPDLKEGIGGLRDYHHMLWLARIFSGRGRRETSSTWAFFLTESTRNWRITNTSFSRPETGSTNSRAGETTGFFLITRKK